jgi:hypothetical protein
VVSELEVAQNEPAALQTLSTVQTQAAAPPFDAHDW